MKRRKIINYILIVVILGIMIWIGLQEYRNINLEKSKINKPSMYDVENVNLTYDLDSESKQEVIIDEAIIKEYPKENIIDKYKNYEVLAKLEIPNIKLETYVLKTCTDDSLNKSVAMFWGTNPNEIGNCCVAGHNAPRNNNMFYNLKKLEIGNTLTISDNDIGKVQYEIYDIYNVLPEDVTCLSQETNGKREVTLITCTNDSSKRTIVKAREV